MLLETATLKVDICAQTGRIVSIAPSGEPPMALDPDAPFWSLDLKGPDGPYTTAAQPDAFAGLSECGGTATLCWRWPDKGLTVQVTAKADGGLLLFSLTASLPANHHVVRADFRIAGLPAEAGWKAAVPIGWGLEYDAAIVALDAAYPSCLAGMAFLSAYKNGIGVYLAAQDPAGHHKQLVARGADGHLELGIAHWAAEADTSGNEYRLPYEVALAGVRRGYEDAAAYYRVFALQAPWSKAGPLSQRPIAPWLLDIDLWLKPGETPWTDDDAECIAATQANLQWCREAKEFFDVPIALHWYRWHQIRYDSMYPEYFPPKAGFIDGVAQARAEGFRVMPYINGRLIDPLSPTWKAGGCDAVARDDNGDTYTEIYGSKVPLSPMCPSTELWRNTISGLVKRIFSEVVTDGVYIDQIAAAYPVRCLDKRHPHSPGGGSFWVESYRRLMEEVRAVLPPDTIVTTEENAETWMDQFDGLLVVNTLTDGSRPIPMYPLVYSGRAVLFGFQYIAPTEAIEGLGFRAKMARAFLWGSQLGWVDAARVMAPEARPSAELLRSLCRTRRFVHRFLVYGRLLGELDARGDNPTLSADLPSAFGGDYHLDIPAVCAAAWQSENGDLGVALANIDDAEHTVEIDLPLAAAGVSESGAYALTIVDAGGPQGKRAATGARQTFTLPPRTALFAVVEG